MSDAVAQEAVPPREQVEYNRLFEALVATDEEKDDDATLVGFVAYVFYKIAKREWVDEFYTKNGRHPTDADIRAYVIGWTESRIEGLRTEARTALSQFSSYIIDRETPAIVKKALQTRSFPRDAGVAFCGALIYTLALVALALVLRLFGIDIEHALSALK